MVCLIVKIPVCTVLPCNKIGDTWVGNGREGGVYVELGLLELSLRCDLGRMDNAVMVRRIIVSYFLRGRDGMDGWMDGNRLFIPGDSQRVGQGGL